MLMRFGLRSVSGTSLFPIPLLYLVAIADILLDFLWTCPALFCIHSLCQHRLRSALWLIFTEYAPNLNIDPV